MPTRNVNLTDALDQFVTSTVAAGRYENASEVVRAGLRALQEREQEYIKFMRNEAAAGFAELDRGEGICGTPDEIMDRINEELGIAAR
jgi:antitoxin ParD1/3/4